MTVSQRTTFLIEYLDLPEAVGDADARWEMFQLQHLNNESLLDIQIKARQVGFSWLCAADAVADSILNPRTPHIFVSINQDEASEKIRYAKQIIEALDREVRPTLLIDNRLELEFTNGSRLISHPCRPVRGKPKARVYLDEFAHYPNDKEIYAAALPATTKGGYIRIGSSPLGASGMFWEIYEQKLKRYPGFKRGFVPWWSVAGLCKDPVSAKEIAPTMLTEERVRLFGTQRIIEIFENMPLEDFQQEYECAWVDESQAWITWDDIKRNQIEAQAGRLTYWHAKTVDDSMRVIGEIAREVTDGRIEQTFAGGMDIGRKHDLTEIFFVGKSTTSHLPLRLMISLAGIPFDDQKAVASRALDVLPVTQLLIDRNGLGMQIAEQLTQIHGARAQGVDFTNASKELWAVEAKVKMQRGEVPIPMDRDLAYQIHSVKKKVTAAKNVTFDTEGNEKHHADKFWALALALWAAKSDTMNVAVYGSNPFGDYRG